MAFACVMALASVIALPGCWGPEVPAPVKDLDKAKKEKAKPPFEPLRIFTEPNERSLFDPKVKQLQRPVTAIKPGHWSGVLVQAQANSFDFGGRLANLPQDTRRNPIELELTPFDLTTSRPVALPKGQRKVFETLFFPPRPDPALALGRTTWISSRLYNSQSSPEQETAEIAPHMPSFQYFLLVLAHDPARYRHLKVLHTIHPPLEFSPVNVEDALHYRVLFPEPDQPLALASQPLCWTSLAAMVWDDVLPSRLSPEQQQAMVDWLHWGGQLIVSGPDSLDKLKGSFLEAWLPATVSAVGPIDAAALSQFVDHWTIPGDESPRPGGRAGGAWSGVTLQPHAEAIAVAGTGDLVFERRVGRGRIVTTAFRLSEPELVAWRSYDGFFNSGLLRRPARKFNNNHRDFEFVTAKRARNAYAPELVSNLRYFTRDALDPERPEPVEPEAEEPDPNNPLGLANPSGTFTANGLPIEATALDVLKGESGVGGWDDFSWISRAARRSLRDAAGISVPKRQFVLKMVGLYLLIIVPLNWLLFRLIGKVEWAWAAVPVIAIAWGFLVIWLAQLDIGFARAQTEIGVLEVQPGYGRAHLTRYIALYSSLSNSYEIEFDSSSAVAQPFSSNQELLLGQSSIPVTLSTLGKPTLSGFPVASNSTGLIHSEEMVTIGAGIHWHDGRLENRTPLKLSGVALVRQRVEPDGKVVNESAWLGTLEPGASMPAKFERDLTGMLHGPREADPISTVSPAEPGLNLRRLLDCAQDHRGLNPGDVRLVAWQDGGFEGLTVTPASIQARRATLVVAHLQYGDLPTAERDQNLPLRTQTMDQQP